MKQAYVDGTLGDSWTAGLKLYDEEEVEVLHYTTHKHWYPEIKEIYGFFPNIKKVSFVEFLHPESKVLSGVPEIEMQWFPELRIPYLPISEDEDYAVLFPHTGREDPMARKIPEATVRKMIDLLAPVRVVLLGTDPQYKDIECYMNLIGKTNISQAISLIAWSNGYCGPEGLPCFVALSHKIPSVVFYIRKQPVEARLLNNPWTEHIIDLINLSTLRS